MVACVRETERRSRQEEKGDIKDGRKQGARRKKDKTGGPRLRGKMAEPELKSRSSRESVAKAASQEKMGGRYCACCTVHALTPVNTTWCSAALFRHAL